jgi:hypothetical protein
MDVREKLIAVLPEIEWIQDPTLREKVVATWIDGLERGGWQPEDIERMPFTLAKKVSANFAQHVRSVTRICADGAFRKSPDGVLVRHAFSGVALADAHGLPAAVQHIIGTHSKEGDPFKRTAEAIVLHFADFMNFDPIEG